MLVKIDNVEYTVPQALIEKFKWYDTNLLGDAGFDSDDEYCAAMEQWEMECMQIIADNFPKLNSRQMDNLISDVSDLIETESPKLFA